MKFSRKKFVKGIALGTIATPFAIRLLSGESMAQNDTGVTLSQQQFKWKMVTTWPPNFPVVGEGATYFADIVRELSNGRLDIQVYGGGELVPALECFDTVRSGAAEMGSGASYYWAGKVPAAQFFSTVPFGMNAQQMNAWLLTGGGLQLWRDLYADFNLIPFIFGNTGVQMGGWFNREINSIADFKGLKMRMPGLGGKVLERAGGTPVLLAGSELYTGLERGILDATEWIGPYHDYKMGFHQIAKYYYTPGWHEPGTVLELIVNKEAYEKLPADLQAIVRVAAEMVNTWVLSEFETKNAEYLSIIEKESEVSIRSFPREVLRTLRGYTKDILAEFVAQDAYAKKVYASFQDYRKRAQAWSALTEKVFYNEIQ
jgi:TRAP-type mannitol/chloroaromatic compound transport system substrate-binding protein